MGVWVSGESEVKANSLPTKERGPCHILTLPYSQQIRSQLILSLEDHNVCGHKLPGKLKKKKHPHNLMQSLLEGRAAEKKY